MTLRYVWPAAFGRFALEATNPSVEDLAHEQMAALEKAVGHSLRKVQVRV